MARNILDQYIDSIGVNVDVENGIIDRTSLAGMTPKAVQNLRAAIKGAADAGLSKIVITAGKGQGHLSHASGTEWDIKGFNADGSKWTNAQRIAVAGAAKEAGADRFGIYEMSKGLGKGTLHIGNSGPGRPPGTWGAHGLTSGPRARQFSNPVEAAFAKNGAVPSLPRAPKLSPETLARYAKDTGAASAYTDAPQLSPSAQYAQNATMAALTPSAIQQAARRSPPRMAPSVDSRFSGNVWDGAGSAGTITPAALADYARTGRGGLAPLGTPAAPPNRFDSPVFSTPAASPLSSALAAKAERATAPPAGPVSGLSTQGLADAVVSRPTISDRFNGPAFNAPTPDRKELASALSQYAKAAAKAPSFDGASFSPPPASNGMTPADVQRSATAQQAVPVASRFSDAAFDRSRSSGSLTPASLSAYAKTTLPPTNRFSDENYDPPTTSRATPAQMARSYQGGATNTDRFTGPAFSPPASSITPDQVQRYATRAAMNDRFSDQNFDPPSAQPSLQPSTLARYVQTAAPAAQQDRFSDLTFKAPTSQPGLSTALNDAARQYAAPLSSVASQNPPAPSAAPAIDVSQPMAQPSLTNAQFDDRWNADTTGVKPVTPVRAVGSPMQQDQQQVAAQAEPRQAQPAAAQPQQDPWAATPKLFRPQVGLGMVGGMVGNGLLGPLGGLLGKIAGKEIGKRLTPTDLPDLTRYIGQGLAAIAQIKNGQAQTGDYAFARNNPIGYTTAWGVGPNGAAMQRTYTPSGRNYSTWTQGPSLSPMELTAYGGNPALEKVQKDRSSSSNGGYTTTTGNLY